MKIKIKDIFQKRRHLLSMILIFVLAVGALGAVYMYKVSPAREKRISVKLNDSYDSFTDSLTDGAVLQTFRTDEPMLALGFILAPADGFDGSVTLRLYSVQTGELLQTVSKAGAENFAPGAYTFFSWDTPLPAVEGGVYRAELSASGSGNITLAKSTDSIAPAVLTNQEGKVQKGTLALTLTTRNLNFSLFAGLFWGVGLLGALFLVLCYYLVFVRRAPLHILFLVFVLVLGGLFSCVLPPYASPDEVFHINEAYSVSNTWFGIKGDNMNNVHKRQGDKNPIIEDRFTSAFTYTEIATNFFARDEGGKVELTPATQVGGFRALYWAAGFGVMLARLLGLGFVQLLYLGRLFNLLLYAALGYFALKKMPFAKLALFALLLLPISIHVGASFSRDSVIMGLALFFIASVLQAAYQEKSVSYAQLAAILISGICLAPAKGVYYPLCFLVLLIPTVKFSSSKKAIIIKCGFLVIFTLMLLWQFSGFFTVFSLAPAASAPGASGAMLAQGTPEPSTIAADSVRYNLAYILEYPVLTFRMLLNTAMENIPHYLSTFVGGKLGYFNLQINPVITALLWMVLLLSSVGSESPSPLLRKEKAFTFLLFLASCGMIVLGCISWTPTYYASVYGIQGRYFLPAALLVFMNTGSAHIKLDDHMRRSLTFLLPLLNLLTLCSAFVQILS